MRRPERGVENRRKVRVETVIARLLDSLSTPDSRSRICGAGLQARDKIAEMEIVLSIQANLEAQTQPGSFRRSPMALCFRDEQSSTRVEQGGLASIPDPANGQSCTLYPPEKIAIPALDQGGPEASGMLLPHGTTSY